MAESDRRIIDGYEFVQQFLFPRILRAATMALQPPRLVLGLLMVAALMTVGRIWHSPTVGPQGLMADRWSPDEAGAGEEGLSIFQATVDHVTVSFNSLVEGLALLRFGQFFTGLGDLFVRTPIAAWQHDKVFTIVYGLFFVVVMALGGGALSRMAATELSSGEKPQMQQAVDFALGAWRRLIFCLLLPLLIAGVLSLLLLGGGWFLMLPWLDLLGGLLYGLALLAGFGVAFLLIGYAAGFSLLVPAVACENCDAADAQQRAYAYVLSRPLHLLGYSVVGFVGLALGFVVVSLFAVALLNISGALVGAVTANAAMDGAGGSALFALTAGAATGDDLSWHSQWSAWLVSFWQMVVVSAVGGYVLAYYFSASTIVYLLMRRVCDGQDIAEIWEPGEVPGTMAPEPEADASDEAQAPADSGAIDEQ
ncbi:MAG: hypothetical protein IH830_11680 [Planctomycetes bacterium]|nr:hypothetical protein [Planctomycetota bacterium]